MRVPNKVEVITRFENPNYTGTASVELISGEVVQATAVASPIAEPEAYTRVGPMACLLLAQKLAERIK